MVWAALGTMVGPMVQSRQRIRVVSSVVVGVRRRLRLSHQPAGRVIFVFFNFSTKMHAIVLASLALAVSSLVNMSSPSHSPCCLCHSGNSQCTAHNKVGSSFIDRSLSLSLSPALHDFSNINVCSQEYTTLWHIHDAPPPYSCVRNQPPPHVAPRSKISLCPHIMYSRSFWSMIFPSPWSNVSVPKSTPSPMLSPCTWQQTNDSLHAWEIILEHKNACKGARRTNEYIYRLCPLSSSNSDDSQIFYFYVLPILYANPPFDLTAMYPLNEIKNKKRHLFSRLLCNPPNP